MLLHRLNILSRRQIVASSTQYPQNLPTMSLHQFRINWHCCFKGKIFNLKKLERRHLKVLRGFICIYIPFTPSSESCSDLAEIFSMTFFNYSKNILLYTLIFLSHTVKKLLTILYFQFLKIYNSVLFKKMFNVRVLSVSLMSQGLITVKIIQISLLLTEM